MATAAPPSDKKYDFVLTEDPESGGAPETHRDNTPKRTWTILEKVLIFLTCLFIIIIIVLIVFLHLQAKYIQIYEQEDVCTSQSCLNTAAELVNIIDKSLDPCDDFYAYTCQSWIKKTIVTGQEVNRFITLEKEMTLKLKDMLEESDPIYGKLPKHFQKALFAYNVCQNSTAREMEALEPLVKDIHDFGGFPALMGDKWDDAKFDYLTLLSEMRKRGYDTNTLFSVYVSLDYKNTSKSRIFITQGIQGMEDIGWWEDDNIVSYYSNYNSKNAISLCTEMGNNCSTSHTFIDIAIKDAVMLEKEIVAMMAPEDYLSDKKKTYNLMTIKEVKQSAPEVDWLRLIRIFLPHTEFSEDTEVIVLRPDFVANMAMLLGDFNRSPDGRRALANYMIYRQVKEASRYLNNEMQRLVHDYDGKVSGTPHIPDNWENCVEFVKKSFEYSLANQYAKKFFPPTRKVLIQQLVQSLKNELVIMLKESRWMDAMTRKTALKKVQNIHTMAGHPDDLLDDHVVNKYYEDLDLKSSHYANYISSRKLFMQKEEPGSNKPVDRREWSYLPSILETGAAYGGTNNSIVISLGMTQDWFIQENAPTYVNYGRIGFVLGHELSHAFDLSGADEDEHGNLRNWWQNGTLKRFLKNSECMVKMFDGYVYKEVNMSLNGAKTVRENIADDASIIEVYAAFKKANQENPQKPLPGLDLTVEQLLWINFGAFWCQKSSPGHLEAVIEGDEHSPAKFRVNSPLSNSMDFLNDFKCKPGDKMYKAHPHCHVWGTHSGA